jgi:hypothetical protein
MADALPPSTSALSEIERLRRLYRLFGATQCRGQSAVYETLSEVVANDDRLLALLLETPTDQRRPSLFFATVNLLLASRPSSELAAYYPTHGGSRTVDERLAPALSDFCGEFRDALLPLLRQRSTQTNEIRRCVALRLGLDYVHRRWSGPLALVEIGASAGLNLMFDHYGYSFGHDQSAAAAGSQVMVCCTVRGIPQGAKLLDAPPPITRRLGIDQHPIDLSDPDARAWLQAFIWPEQVDDLRNLRSAMDLVMSTSIVTMKQGEAAADTARLLADLPGREPVVVFTASLLSYLGAEARNTFVTQLKEAADRRSIAWVFAEGPGLLATMGLDIAALSGPVSRDNAHYLVGASLFGLDRDDKLLALADPYLRWVAPARGPADDFRWVSNAAQR